MGNPNHFDTFRDLVATNAFAPATSNLFEVRITPSPIMQLNEVADKANRREIADAINYFASTVTVPSRALTTSEINNIGMMRRFATGQTNSEITISFLVTKDQIHRDFFESWMHQTASDSDNTVAFYDDYVCDMEIIKWEHGANFKIKSNRNAKSGYHPKQSTAVWKLFGAFPTNISTMSFDNEQTGLLQLDIQFFFERYRFDQVSRHTLKPRESGKPRLIFTEDISELIAGSGNPDVQRFTL